MAGNIVKWWKHKILGGYKQFTVLQECATDSEELIYPGRAPSACSAPPDLLLTSDREQMLKVKSSSSTGAATGQTKTSVHHHHHHGHHQQSPAANGHNHSSASQQQQPQQHHKSQKDAFRKSASGKMGGGVVAGASGGGTTNTLNTTAATIRSDPDRVRLEEFTCDVSLEDGKKPQPLQFSFTLYDLDGHGKITKDDIAGIVSTIYESIGKSVVVPHYGSKTINVRLTVSPDGKTATTKPASAAVKKAIVTPRRRYRSRKLISDDDGSDTSENCPRLLRNRTAATATAVNNGQMTNNNQTAPSNQQHQQQHHHHHHHPNGNSGKLKESNLTKATALAGDCQVKRLVELSNSPDSTPAVGQLLVEAYHNNFSAVTSGAATGLGKNVLNNASNANKSKTNENIYESINNLKCCNLQQQQQHQQSTSHNTSIQTTVSSLPVSAALNQSTASTAALICRDCIDGPTTTLIPTLSTLETVVIPTPPSAIMAGRAKRKLVRKTRSSRKTAVAAKMMAEDFQRRPRARSLSVGNENCYENVIGRMAAAQEECWKSSLCRRELIEIIRESMVKNSLCFQPNRKAIESSPKHRHRSHTIASRVGDQVFFNYHHPTAAALMAANNGAAVAAELGGTQAATTSTTTTALFTIAGHETNLCGYDSYLHKTICAAANGGGNASSMQLAAAHTTAAINGAVPVLATSTPNRLLQQHFHHSKIKRKEHHRLAAAVGAVRSTQHPAPVKLSTALLNQQYPNLSAEQKLTRSINQVEQWLDHRSPKILPKVKLTDETQPTRTVIGRPLKRSKSKEELTPSNLLLLENLKISEDIAEIAVVTPKKVYNKESLIASATKKNIKTHHQHSSSRQQTTPGVEMGVEKSAPTATVTKQSTPNGDAQLVQLQYGSVPVNAEPSECENLIRMSDDGEDESQQQSTMATGKHHYRHPHQQSRSQPQSPQHHQHHHQQHAQESRHCGSGGAHSVSSASAASTTAVHRYVHEHIHHHYHHFENDPDES
ncbi:protein naked cuticle homolog [Anopheles funestus]|uniref:protein naked cuticle homolog n=1 Tax=Anopheles funestus TaxID=62324 RepID=UPI0020C6FCB0|nr:protein naked cuticle homolog [Anopheles funestus]